MAVFQGARLRNAALPADDPLIAPRPQAPSRSNPRVRPAGLLMAAILAATMVGLAYLTQTLGSNATSSEITDLAAKSAELDRSLRTHAYSVEIYIDPIDISKRAQKMGLTRLGKVKILPAP